jgi:hypothetical protein
MVDDQTVNKIAKPLKKGKKKNHWFMNSRISLSCSGVTPLAFSPIFLCLLGRLRAGIWWFWSPLVVGGGWVVDRLVFWVVAWRIHGPRPSELPVWRVGSRLVGRCMVVQWCGNLAG